MGGGVNVGVWYCRRRLGWSCDRIVGDQAYCRLPPSLLTIGNPGLPNRGFVMFQYFPMLGKRLRWLPNHSSTLLSEALMSSPVIKTVPATSDPALFNVDFLIPSLSVELQVAVIAAAAALGAAVFAFIASMIDAKVQRENAKLEAQTASNIKLAEFRQIWIDRLREDFVALQVKISQSPSDIDKEIGESIFRIFLMINKDDPSIENIKSVISQSLRAGEEGRKAQVELLTIFQGVLKSEWEVVKRDLNGGPQ